MDTINERINQIVSHSGLSKTAFGKEINLTQSMVSKLCSGAATPSDRTVSDICRVFSINEEWLRTGNGSMTDQNSNDEDPLFQVGDSYFNGNLVVDSVENDDSGRVTVTFHVDETGMKPEELVALFNMIDTFSKDRGMSVGGLAQLAEAASRAAKEIADNHLQKPPQD